MSRPIVIAYHLIWTIYGYWLPNDPRGSTSRTIRNDILKDLGELHFGRKKVQPTRLELRQFDRSAAPLLKHSVQKFNAAQIEVIKASFEEAISSVRYTCYACAVLSDHVHLLIRKHRDSAETMIANLQRSSHLALRDAGQFDLDHPIWGGHGWSVFLDSPEDVWRTIRYIEGNLRPPTRYPFVTAYNNWPLHPGHSPFSPYAKRLRRGDA